MNKFLLIPLSVALLSIGCGPSAPKSAEGLTDLNVEEDMSTDVNVLEQALPTLMVIPSDFLLKNNGALQTIESQGRTIYNRDYTAYLLQNAMNKYLIGTIQTAFIDRKFPLNDLEQMLKSLNNSEIIDQANELGKDSKTILLTTASPDIILELDYKKEATKYQSTLIYTLTALDSYTNKAIASLQNSIAYNLEDPIQEKFKASLEGELSRFIEQIQTAFVNMLRHGREITVRVAIDRASKIKLNDDLNDEMTYADWLRNYMNKNSKKGANKLQRNTASEMMFVNVRIPNQTADGMQYNAYEFANKLRRELSKELQVKATNASQGLGDAVIIIN